MPKAKPDKKIRAKTRPPAPKPGLQHVSWEAVELEQLNPLIARQYVVGKNVMLSRIFLGKGSIVPRHSHHNEQLSYILEGKLVFSIDGKKLTVKAGEVLLIPPNMPHQVEALEDSLSLDIFDPPRQDWIDKTDDYLRITK